MKRIIEEKITKEVEFDVPSAYQDGNQFFLVYPTENERGYSVDSLCDWSWGMTYKKRDAYCTIPFEKPVPISVWIEKFEQFKDFVNDEVITYMRLLPTQEDIYENQISAI